MLVKFDVTKLFMAAFGNKAMLHLHLKLTFVSVLKDKLDNKEVLMAE